MHDHGLLVINRQISHTYSESFAKPCAYLLYNSATSSNSHSAICIQIISCTSKLHETLHYVYV